MTRRLSSFLNASRWWAAFLVVAHHVRHLVFADASDVTLHGAPVKLFYFLTSFGPSAVMVFFVISGYLVGGKAIARVRAHGFDAGDYAAHRISRIYTVLVPALVVGGALDAVGLHCFNRSELYTNAAHHPALAGFLAVTDNLNAPTFFANLFMLEDVVTKRLGTNNPLWSLVYEWWYYCIFAAATLAAIRGAVLVRTLAAIALVAMCALLPHALVLYGLVWALGIGAALYGASARPTPAPWLAAAILAATAVALKLTEREALAPQHGDALVVPFLRSAALAAAYALLLLAYHTDGPPLATARADAWLARFSYSLYLVHFPMIVLTVAVLHDAFGVPFFQPPSAGAALYFASLLAAAVGFGWAFAQLTERHTSRVRAALCSVARPVARRLSPRLAAPPGPVPGR